MKKHLIILLTFFGLVSCTNDFSSSEISSNEQSNSSLVSSINSNPQSTSLSSSLEISSSINEVSSTNKVDPNVDFTKLTMNCLGDSITYASNYKDVAPYQKSYCDFIVNELGLKKANNYGLGGSPFSLSGYSVDTPSESFIERYDDMEDADIISVFGGVNDFIGCSELGTISSNDNNTFYGALNNMINGLKNKFPNSFIFFITPYKCNAPQYNAVYNIANKSGYVLEDYVNAIKELCNSHNIPYLDFYNNGNLELDFDNNTIDGLHPTEEFHIKYTTPQIIKFIKDNYK